MGLLSGRPNTPQYMGLARPSVPYGLLTRKLKGAEKAEFIREHFPGHE